MRIERILVTPELAKHHLLNNKNNRKATKLVIERYAEEMKNGHWKQDTGELIKISKVQDGEDRGRLIDGQHRLLAIVKSGVSIYMHIAYDVDASVFDVLDTGKKRSSADVFYLNGVKNSTCLPSIIGTFKRLESGKFPQKRVLPNHEIYGEYEANSEQWDQIANFSLTMYRAFAKVLKPSIIGGVYSHISSKNKDLSKDFIEQLCTGAGITNSTILILRNSLINDKLNTKRKLTITQKVGLIIKTWNLFIDGRTVKRIAVDANKFPVTKFHKD